LYSDSAASLRAVCLASKAHQLALTSAAASKQSSSSSLLKQDKDVVNIQIVDFQWINYSNLFSRLVKTLSQLNRVATFRKQKANQIIDDIECFSVEVSTILLPILQGFLTITIDSPKSYSKSLNNIFPGHDNVFFLYDW
jgi:hypothetical protein